MSLSQPLLYRLAAWRRHAEIVHCLEQLHDDLKEGLEPLLEFRRGTTQSFFHSLAQLQQDALDAVSLSVRDEHLVIHWTYARCPSPGLPFLARKWGNYCQRP